MAAKSVPATARLNNREKVWVNGNEETGIVRKVAWSDLETLLNKQKLEAYRSKLFSESPKTMLPVFPD